MPFDRRIRRALIALVVAAFPAGSDLHAQNGTVDDAARRATSATVRPGDRIELQFRRDRELNASVNVNERGEGVFPKLGIIEVADITIGALQDTLRARYSEFLRTPELEVTVLRRVVVNGEVRVPNIHMLDVASSTVRDAIARSGGLLETANKNKVYIIRDGARIQVKDWEKDVTATTDLLSGDQVLVGRKSWFVLNALPLVSTSVIVIGLIQSLRN